MSLKVLIVEDEFLIALDLQMEIESLGHSVVGPAKNIATMQDAVSRTLPDLAFMDIRLSGGDNGIDAARWLRETHDIRCIFMSGNLDDRTVAQAETFAPYGFLGKPIFMTQVGALLDYVQTVSGAQAAGQTS